MHIKWRVLHGRAAPESLDYGLAQRESLLRFRCDIYEELPTFSGTRTETPSLALFALGKESHPLAGAKGSAQGQHPNRDL